MSGVLGGSTIEERAEQDASFAACGNYYHIVLCQLANRTDSGVWLPDQPAVKACDGIVLHAGPGRVLRSGARFPLQARVGDRVVVQEHCVVPFQRGDAWVRDEDLVAVIPGPDHTDVIPANDWVFVHADVTKRLEERESGVVVSHLPLRGKDSRILERGEELLRDFLAHGEQMKAEGVPSWERIEKQRKQVSYLCPQDRDALAIAYELKGETHYADYVRPTSAPTPRSGVLLSTGSGRVREDGVRDWETVARKAGWSMIPMPWETGEDRPQKVYWDDADTVELYDGHQFIRAVPADALCAVEVPDKYPQEALTQGRMARLETA